MVNKTQSVLFSDIKIKGNISEKESITIYGKVTGNINAKLVAWCEDQPERTLIAVTFPTTQHN